MSDYAKNLLIKIMDLPEGKKMRIESDVIQKNAVKHRNGGDAHDRPATE